MSDQDYLMNVKNLSQSYNCQDYCLTSNLDEGYKDIYTFPEPEELNQLLSKYHISRCDSISEKIKEKYGVNVAILGSGSEELIVRSNCVILEKGFTPGIIVPTFYRILETLSGVKYNVLSYDELADSSSDIFKKEAIWIVNPNPLTGQLIEKNKLLEIFGRYPNTLFLIDEAAMFLTNHWRVHSLLSETSDNCNFVVLSSFSKLHGLSGARAGFASGNLSFLRHVRKKGATFPLTSITTYLLEKALSVERPWRIIRDRIFKNKSEVEAFLSDNLNIEISPSVNNCIYCHYRDSTSLYKRLLHAGIISLNLDTQAGVSKNGYVRITTHSSKKLHTNLLHSLMKI